MNMKRILRVGTGRKNLSICRNAPQKKNMTWKKQQHHLQTASQRITGWSKSNELEKFNWLRRRAFHLRERSLMTHKKNVKKDSGELFFISSEFILKNFPHNAQTVNEKILHLEKCLALC